MPSSHSSRRSTCAGQLIGWKKRGKNSQMLSGGVLPSRAGSRRRFRSTARGDVSDAASAAPGGPLTSTTDRWPRPEPPPTGPLWPEVLRQLCPASVNRQRGIRGGSCSRRGRIVSFFFRGGHASSQVPTRHAARHEKVFATVITRTDASRTTLRLTGPLLTTPRA